MLFFEELDGALSKVTDMAYDSINIFMVFTRNFQQDLGIRV